MASIFFFNYKKKTDKNDNINDISLLYNTGPMCWENFKS